MLSASERAYEQIKAAIMSGEMEAGDRIKEELIAERIGVSRTPIRHALQKLAAQGFIEMHHNHGATVTNWSAQSLGEITDMNSQFHVCIIHASGNRRLADVIGNLAHPLLVQRRFSGFSKARLQRSMDHHREIINALAARDPDWASSIMRSHILASANKAAAQHD